MSKKSINVLLSILSDMLDLSEENLGKAEEFIKQLLPDTMTVGGRTCKIISYLQKKKKHVNGNTMANRTKELKANLGKKECRHILKHQGDIPAQLREKVFFVFTDWRHPVYSEEIACVCWDGGCWVRLWRWIGRDWNGDDRVLRCE